MDNQELVALITQHSQILDQVHSLWIAIVLLVFVQIVGLFALVGTAVWSVTTVIRSNAARTGQLEDQWASHQQEIRTALTIIVQTLREARKATSE